MKFPYREYVSTFPGSSDFRLILRPVITVEVTGPKAAVRWDALVDTGADETLLPIGLASILGIDLNQYPTSHAAGFSGERLSIHYGDVSLRLESDAEIIEWKTTVGFADFATAEDEVLILGHGGCLDYFTALFDGEAAELELVPNSLLPVDDG